MQELRKIAKVLDVKKTDKELLEIFHKVYATGYTFHKGRVGMWKDFFNEEHVEIFNEQMEGELR